MVNDHEWLDQHMPLDSLRSLGTFDYRRTQHNGNRMVDQWGLEPQTPCLQSRCSTN